MKLCALCRPGAPNSNLPCFVLVSLRQPTAAEVPEVEAKWFGEGPRTKEDGGVRPFKVSVGEKELADLKRRLEADLERGVTPPLEGAAFSYGFNGDYLRQEQHSQQFIFHVLTFSHSFFEVLVSEH